MNWQKTRRWCSVGLAVAIVVFFLIFGPSIGRAIWDECQNMKPDEPVTAAAPVGVGFDQHEGRTFQPSDVR